ncbi:MAG: hypothetical protein L0Y61_02630, partial [Epsilonproteobacteria bacterium]|nr:hypothetical protein [Campylobacterota bacterium]
MKRANREVKTENTEDDAKIATEETQISKELMADKEVLNKRKEEVEKIIEMIKSTYKGYDDLQEMVTDLSYNNFIDYWARKFCEEDYGRNIELAKKLFEVLANTCESSSDFSSLASDISREDTLNDKDWAKELFKKAIELAEDDKSDLRSIADNIANSDKLNDKDWAKELYQNIADNLNELSDYNNLVSSISRYLEDTNWAKDLVVQAKDALLNADDKFEFAGFGSEIISLAENISDSDLLDDKDSAKEVFEILKEYEGVTDLLDAARKVKEIYEDESEYVEEYMNECLEKAIENVQEGYYCDIYYFIKNDLEDEDRADEFKDNYI